MARSAMVPLMILCSLPILSLWVGVDGAGHHLSAPPAPLSSSSVDCSSLILDMADCVSFVTNGSNVSKPEGSCCSGLKTVLNTDAQCLCEAFNNSTQYGVPSLNVTKALSLPSACNLRAPSAPSCARISTIGIDTCVTEVQALDPCFNFIRQGGTRAPTAQCCTSIAALARSRAAVNTICGCFEAIYFENPTLISRERLLGLPGTCKTKGLLCR